MLTRAVCVNGAMQTSLDINECGGSLVGALGSLNITINKDNRINCLSCILTYSFLCLQSP